MESDPQDINEQLEQTNGINNYSLINIQKKTVAGKITIKTKINQITNQILNLKKDQFLKTP